MRCTDTSASSPSSSPTRRSLSAGPPIVALYPRRMRCQGTGFVSADPATNSAVRAVRFHRHAARLLVALAALVPAGCAPESGLGTSFEEITVCADGTTVPGIDVSVYQGTINWAQVRAAGKRFAFIRVANATTMDTTFVRNWAGAREAGVLRGAYQYFQPDRDAVAQADLVVRAVGRLGEGDLPAVIDVETANSQTPATIVARVRTWMDRVEAGTGRRPIIYTGPYFWNTSVGGSNAFTADPLWIAHYTTGCPMVPNGWTRWGFWQNSSTGRVTGITGNVDTDSFNGTYEQLAALAGATPTGPEYAARYVAQSWPLASAGALRLRAGESVDAWIELRNTGTHFWDEHTHFATTVPRDRDSLFAGGDWVRPSRAAAVTGMVMPGETFRFAFAFHGPATPGMYTEHFGVVQDGTAWFSDPAQGGPPDEQIEARFEVLPGAAPDVLVPDVPAADSTVSEDSAVESDASESPDVSPADAARVDAARVDAAREEAGADAARADAGGRDAGGVPPVPSGCTCAATPGNVPLNARTRAAALAGIGASLGALVARRRARRGHRARA